MASTHGQPITGLCDLQHRQSVILFSYIANGVWISPHLALSLSVIAGWLGLFTYHTCP